MGKPTETQFVVSQSHYFLMSFKHLVKLKLLSKVVLSLSGWSLTHFKIIPLVREIKLAKKEEEQFENRFSHFTLIYSRVHATQ